MRLRTLVVVFLTIIFSAMTFSGIALIRLTDHLHETVLNLEEVAKSVSAAQLLTDRLNSLNRSMYIRELKGPSEEVIQPADVQIQLEDALASLDQAATTEKERELISDTRREINTYFSTRAQLVESGKSAQETYLALAPYVDAANIAIHRLADLNREQASEFVKEASVIDSSANFWGFGTLSVAIFLVFFAFFLSIRTVIRPIRNIGDAISVYDRSRKPIEIPESGVEELKQVAHAFSELTENLELARKEHLRFLAAVAHDLKNPLGAIAMSAEMIETDDQDTQEMLQIMKRQARLLERMISDLLDSVRVESGVLPIQPVQTDLRALASDAVNLFRSVSKNHVIEMKSSRSEHTSLCDPVRISQVLNNLLSNALKYSPYGGKIQLSIFDEGNEVVLCVSDEGIGIHANELDSIFEPFRRSQSTKDSIPGIGLGLSVSKKLVEAHEGSLTVSSKVGRGTTFEIRLPKS